MYEFFQIKKKDIAKLKERPKDFDRLMNTIEVKKTSPMFRERNDLSQPKKKSPPKIQKVENRYLSVNHTLKHKINVSEIRTSPDVDDNVIY